MPNQEFLDSIKDEIQALWDEYEILPSVAAGQAAHESKYGASGLATDANALFGIKASDQGSCDPDTGELIEGDPEDVICSLTWEEENGEEIQLYEPFRRYDSFTESIKDYGEFLYTGENYQGALGKTDPEEFLEELGDYATDSNYTQAVMNVIDEYNLREWDEEMFNGDNEEEVRPGTHLIALGHGPDNSGGYDNGASGNGTTEAEVLRGPFYDSLQAYADETEADIEFYDQNMYANDDAQNNLNYDTVTELHMDGSEDPAATGGHVIIYVGAEPNAMDKAFRDMIKDHFGLWNGTENGFDNTRDKLKNLNVFQSNGVDYRLLELGFITSTADFEEMDNDYDEVAKDIIEIIADASLDDGGGGEDPDPEPTGDSLEDVQQWLNDAYNTGLDVDGAYGPLTQEAIVIGVQTELNEQYNAGLSVDGLYGPATQAGFVTVRSGAEGNLTRLIQGQLIVLGYDPNGFDGIYGPGLTSTVEQFQLDQGLTVDGVVGTNTANTLFNNYDVGGGSGGSDSLIEEIQQFLNNTYNTSLSVDGAYGRLTQEAIVIGVQTELNEQFGTGLTVDGIFGSATQSAFVNITPSAEGNITRLIQAQLIGLGYEPNGFDGVYGPGLEEAVRAYQSANELTVDGIVGPTTANSLFNAD